MWITPAIFIAWGVIGLLMRSGPLTENLLHWLAAALVGAGVGAVTRVPLQVDPQRNLVVQPGSVLPLIRNVGIFGAHYVLNVLAAIKPEMSAHYMTWDIYVSGCQRGLLRWLGHPVCQELSAGDAPGAERGGEGPVGSLALLRVAKLAQAPERPAPASLPSVLVLVVPVAWPVAMVVIVVILTPIARLVLPDFTKYTGRLHAWYSWRCLRQFFACPGGTCR